MIQITIAMLIGIVLGYWIKPTITDAVKDAKIASLEAFGDECGDIILKQKKRIETLECRLDVMT
jgi:hypothetical protein